MEKLPGARILIYTGNEGQEKHEITEVESEHSTIYEKALTIRRLCDWVPARNAAAADAYSNMWHQIKSQANNSAWVGPTEEITAVATGFSHLRGKVSSHAEGARAIQRHLHAFHHRQRLIRLRKV